MLNRCSPRFMTCMVTGNGNPSPSCPLIFPVAMYPTIAISPRATVPGIRGRADIPSEKKSLGSSGSYFGWTAMRWRQVRRQKAESRSTKARRILLPSAFCLPPSPGNIGDLPWLERFQKIPRLVELEFRIARVNDEKEFVARGLIESRHVEHRVIRHRQAVEREHSEDRRECRQQNRAFERDRNPRRPAVEGLAAHVDPI